MCRVPKVPVVLLCCCCCCCCCGGGGGGGGGGVSPLFVIDYPFDQ